MRGDDRSRSRSRGRGGKDVQEAARGGSSEQEIVSVAIRQLPPDIRERLEKLFEEGLLKEGDLDLRSITVFASLNEGLQARVMNHMEGERIYVANARSKSGFLIATCDKAKTGCLDARGLGAIDPWRTALVAMATPKQKQVDLKPERDWLDQHEEAGPIKIQVTLGSAVEAELGVPSVTVELPLTETSSAIKAKLVAMGVKAIAQNKMMLRTDPVGFLKDRHSFAFYNFKNGVSVALSERKRGGSRFRADHTVMPKRPKTQSAPDSSPAASPSPAQSPLDALRHMTAQGAKMPAMPNMPKLPGMPGLPGLPSLGTAPTGLSGLPGGLFGSKMPAMPGMPGLPGLNFGGMAPGGMSPGALAPPKLGGLGLPPGLPLSMPGAGLGGLGGLGGLAGMAKAPGLPSFTMPNFDLAKAGGGLPGLPPMGADPKAAAMSFMAKMGGGPPLGLPMQGGCGLAPPAMMSKGGGMPPAFSMPGLPKFDAGAPPAMGSTPKGASPA
mmetsp:Transcript_78211/g.198769  ORF Transcript_78211/g.198769 Transcript_78211/m.198769 type:complete len:496 (+) Transcript_78211:122-1609(+)